MHKNRALLVALTFICSTAAAAQVVFPNEIKDPTLRSLQTQYSFELTEAGKEILAIKFPYPFYLSRKLDIDEEKQKRADQRSLRFDHYGDEVVVAVSGNYYAAYSGAKVNPDHRAYQSFTDVILPILRAVVPHFQSIKDVQGYAVEISHHVIATAMSVTMEQPENLMVFLPQKDAIKLLGSQDENAQQAALLDGKVFLNGEELVIWLNGEGPPPGFTLPTTHTENRNATAEASPQLNPPPAPAAVEKLASPPRDTSPPALAKLQVSKQLTIDRLVKELGPQAHFVNYVPQDFIVFRGAIYLELSLTTDLTEQDAGSHYRIAALAFDNHIAHLLRPTTAYFKDESDFDGISFSTTVKVAGKSKTSGTSEAVEFFVPLDLLRCYEKYDCTGQQVIDGGTVLINGERVALNLQTAEAPVKF